MTEMFFYAQIVAHGSFIVHQII